MWQCKQCDEKIEDTFDSCWNCGKERIDDNNKTKTRDEDDTEKREAEGIEKEKIENEKVEKQRIEDEDNQIKDYPAIRFLSQVSTFLAWVGIFVGIIGYFIWLDGVSRYVSDEQKVIMFFAVGIGIFIYFILWKAVSELLIIIVDIARDLRRTRLNKES